MCDDCGAAVDILREKPDAVAAFAQLPSGEATNRQICLLEQSDQPSYHGRLADPWRSFQQELVQADVHCPSVLQLRSKVLDGLRLARGSQ